MSNNLGVRNDAAWEQAYKQCSNGDLTVTTCSPTAQTVAYQGQWVHLVWNGHHPRYARAGQIDVKVFRNDSNAQPTLVFTRDGVPSPTKGQHSANSMAVQVADSWFAGNEEGFNSTSSFYFTVAPGGGTSELQPAFRAIQTA
ncbi:unnamed protein product [Peniophora sp. CBMAI 1063]|nr:unnamed protein product [Peniophora sp. CBMAI 1063]